MLERRELGLLGPNVQEQVGGENTQQSGQTVFDICEV